MLTRTALYTRLRVAVIRFVACVPGTRRLMSAMTGADTTSLTAGDQRKVDVFRRLTGTATPESVEGRRADGAEGRPDVALPDVADTPEGSQGRGDDADAPGADGGEDAGNGLLLDVEHRVRRPQLPQPVAIRSADQRDVHLARVGDGLAVEIDRARVEVRELDGVEEVEVLAQLPV